MIDVAWAQAGGGAGGPPTLVSFLPLALVFVVFYFMLIRPQQQKTKEHRVLLANLRKNDEIITSGGLYGRVLALSDDVVTVEIAPNVKVRISRPQIATVVSAPKPARRPLNDREKDTST
jgi:preprotein translocase subunit YajC